MSHTQHSSDSLKIPISNPAGVVIKFVEKNRANDEKKNELNLFAKSIHLNSHSIERSKTIGAPKFWMAQGRPNVRNAEYFFKKGL